MEFFKKSILKICYDEKDTYSNIDLFADLIDNLDDASNLYGLYKKSAIYRIQKEFKRISFKLCNLKKKLINKY